MQNNNIIDFERVDEVSNFHAETMDCLGSLSYIKISNFKSYKGDAVVGPFRHLTIVAGRNGSGKSNFADAIAFVMGASLNTLRAKTFNSLIHGGNIQRYISNSAFVMAVFSLPDGTTRQFCRTIILQGNESAITKFHVDDKAVREKLYLEELHRLGVCKNLENMFIFQGNVESFVRLKPKDITALIEKLSGAGNLKREYNKFSTKIKNYEEQLADLNNRKKILTIDRSLKRKEQSVFDEYRNLLLNLDELQLQYNLMQLYHNEKQTRGSQAERKKLENEIKVFEEQKADAVSKVDKQKIIQLHNQIFEVEGKLNSVEKKLWTKYEELRNGEGKLEQLRNKLQTYKASMEYEERIILKQRTVIQDLENDLKDVQKRIDDFEEITQSQGIDFQLEEENVKEYNVLKEIAGVELMKLRHQFNKATLERKPVQEKLDTEMCKKAQIDHQIKALKNTYDNIDNQLQRVNTSNRDQETNLQQKKELRDNLQEKANVSNLEIETVKKKLEDLVEKLNEMNFGNNSFMKQQKILRVIADLRIIFGENIVGLMSDLCQPIHERYKLALTKVMGRNLSALVVKNRQTGLAVINYLKTHRLPAMYILPLDNVKVHPIKSKLRDLGNSIGRNVKLLVDLVKCRHPNDMPAVQYALSNWLVTDNEKDGRDIAYKIGNGVRFNVVTVNGTCFYKDGIVSCGKMSLQEKAKRWFGIDVLEAQNMKVKLRAELQELQKEASSETEVKKISQEISTLEIHLKYIKEQQKLLEEKLNTFRSRLEAANDEAAQNDVVIATVKQKLEKCDEKINDIQSEMNKLEDSVFADFCSKIGIPNIRAYEGVSLREYQERMQRKEELRSLQQNIINQIEYEKETLNSRLASSKKYEIQIGLKAELREGEEKLIKDKREKNRYLKQLNDLKSEICGLKSELLSEKKKDIKVMEELKKLTNNLRQANSEIHVIELKIRHLEEICYSLLSKCKVEGLFIPMEHGTMEDIREGESSSVNDSSMSNDNNRFYRTQIRIDYSRLKQALKNTGNVDESAKSLSAEIEDILKEIRSVKVNVKVSEEFQQIEISVAKIQSDIVELLKLLQQTRSEFNEIKKERREAFMNFFNAIEAEVDILYKEIYESATGTAILTLENNEEPYSGGVRYSVQVPGKKCIAMDCLSGGEATMASLAFLFALNRYRKAPFVLLDEPDGSLDKENVLRLATFLKKNTDVQIIVTSHSNKYAYATVANELIGISMKRREDGIPSSKIYIMAIDEYLSVETLEA